MFQVQDGPLIYWDRNCQKAHWAVHKEYCKIWAETSANNGNIPVARIKLKMSHLIWLVRGIPDYISFLFKEYLFWKRKSKRGFVEFYFESFEELFDAIGIIEQQPVINEALFCRMPGSPSIRSASGFGNIPQPIQLRKVKPEHEATFIRAVDDKLSFTQNKNRPNLQRGLDRAHQSDNIFVTVKLQGRYSTHMYDFFYKGLSWCPE